MENKAICGFVISGISLTPDTDEREACVIASNELKRAGINPARIRFSIYKKSVDARKKNDVRLVYSVCARFETPQKVKTPSSKKYKIAELLDGELEIKYGAQTSEYRPLVVGMGPAGLFCALLLAENGYEPIIIDRGDSVSKRAEKYDEFFKLGVLDTESNIQFGAGGAGTFSDGKLLTRINDPKIGYVLRRFCDFGAPEEILTNAKPHIGTDLSVRLSSLVRYNTLPPRRSISKRIFSTTPSKRSVPICGFALVSISSGAPKSQKRLRT